MTFRRGLFLAIVLSVVAFGKTARGQVDDVLPDSHKTPGIVATTDVALICVRGYARSIRPRGIAWRRLKDAAYAAYGIPRGKRSFPDANGRRHPAYEVDHLISLELGGSPTDLRNLWPEPIASAKRKDRVEDALHKRVCSGHEPLAAAQTDIAHDWRTALGAKYHF